MGLSGNDICSRYIVVFSYISQYILWEYSYFPTAPINKYPLCHTCGHLIGQKSRIHYGAVFIRILLKTANISYFRGISIQRLHSVKKGEYAASSPSLPVSSNSRSTSFSRQIHLGTYTPASMFSNIPSCAIDCCKLGQSASIGCIPWGLSC